MKLLIVLVILTCHTELLRGEDFEDIEESGSLESIAEKIDRINAQDGAPRCLEEGDIMGDDCDGSASKRTAVRNRNRLWHTRIVPYYIHSSLARDVRTRRAISDAIRDYHLYTCIRFRRVSPKSGMHKIRFFKGDGCFSKIGKTGGKEQSISIGRGCGIKGIVIHEIMHALGFWHEQSRYDRDRFVTIHWDNIKDNKEGNFKKKTIKQSTTLGQAYDYDGIMHYGRKAFAIDRTKDTITPKRPGVSIGQREGFSHTDLAQLNSLYDCETHCSKKWSQWSSWSPCIMFGASRREQRQRFCMARNVRTCSRSLFERVEKEQRNCGTGITGIRRAIICENQRRWLLCPKRYNLHIVRAHYGRTSAYVCNGVDRYFATTNCRSNVRRRVRQFCQGRRHCRLLATGRVFGNPCCLTYKYLDVRYRCLPSRG